MESGTLCKASNSHWFALTTKYRYEKKVDRLLKQKGYASYLPLYERVSYWSDRKRKISEPLFSCYLFVNIDLKDRIGVLQTDGAVRFISFENRPVAIPDEQITMVRNLLNGKREIEAVTSFQQGQRVKVNCGPMNGLEGVFIRQKDQAKLIITLDHLDQSIAVEIDADEVMPLELRVKSLRCESNANSFH